MKPRKRVVKKENKSVKITIICLIAIILLCILILMLKITNNDTVYAYENNIIQNENRAPRLEDKIEQKRISIVEIINNLWTIRMTE